MPVPRLGACGRRNGQYEKNSYASNAPKHARNLANNIPPHENNEQPESRHQGWRRSHPRVRTPRAH
jgi:hypothetical protein